MSIEENFSLRMYNSFGIDVQCQYFARFSTMLQLEQLLNVTTSPALILGGGSNLLLTKKIEGWVLKNEVNGIVKVQEDDEYVYIKAGAGVNWHSFVCYCIENNWAGVENLSLIPGNVGASPMQNIGAYGVELKDVFWELTAWHIGEKKMVLFKAADCAFGYRESVFKNKYRGQFIILDVTFRLNKTPTFKTSYGAIEAELQRMQVTDLSIKTIAAAVINIRRSKLPDPKKTGNAGSFFKNPVINAEKYLELKEKYPAMPGYVQADGSIKLAAGWLIENTGPSATSSWKGYRNGDAGCHSQQALVLVNYGNASGAEILSLSKCICASVSEKFNVTFETEVNIF